VRANPDPGREGEIEEETSQPKQILVVNSGPTGIEAAHVAASRRHRVKLWDEKSWLGGRWSWLLKPYIVDRPYLLAEPGVEVKLGKTRLRFISFADLKGIS